MFGFFKLDYVYMYLFIKIFKYVCINVLEYLSKYFYMLLWWYVNMYKIDSLKLKVL